MQRSKCEKCGKLLVPPMGSHVFPHLLVGDFPGYHENITGMPITFGSKPNETRSGDVLKTELIRVGLNLGQFYITNLWGHPKDEKECDLSLHVDSLVKLFPGRTHVLLMGSDVTKALLDVKLQQVSGLQVKVPGFPNIHFWASPNPALAMSQPIGELRLALRRFSEDIKSTSKTK